MKKNWYVAVNGFRGILALLIIMLHFEGMYIGRQKYFETGYLAVDCFFILSGFFLMKKLMTISESDILPLKMVFDKIKKIYPIYIGMIALAVITCLAIPGFLNYITIRPDIIISESLLAQCSFGCTELINGVDWFVSALVLATFCIVLCYKVSPKIYVNLIAPISIIIIYLSFASRFGHLDIHMHTIGIFRGGLLRAIAGMNLGLLVCYFYNKYQQTLANFKYSNYLETLLALSLFFLCISNKHSNLDFILPFCASLFLLSILQESGVVAIILKNRILQKLGDLSMAIFLTQFLVIYFFMLFLPQLAGNRILSTSLFICVELVFAWLCDLLFNKKGLLSIWKRFVSISYHEYILIGIILFAIFIIQQPNVWAETVAEYQRYIYGESLVESFAGYLTVLPVLMAYMYHYIFLQTPISWYTFASVFSMLYAMLCCVAILYVMKKMNVSRWNRCIIFIPILSLLVHPSVNSIINITHLGYVPVIIYILLCIINGQLFSEIKEIPYIALVPLVLASLSKPSFFCLAFFIIAFVTDLYKKPAKLLILVASAIISALQIFLLASGGTQFGFGSFVGFTKFILIFINAIGAAFLFPITYFIDGDISYGLIALSGLLGLLFCYMLYKTACLHWHKFKFKRYILVFILLLTVAACLMPYIAFDYSQSFNQLLLQSMNLIFSKHKLQYQLTSSVIIVVVFLFLFKNCFEKIKEIKYSQTISIVLFIVLLNGLCCGMYSSHWQTVHVIDGDSIQYSNEQPFVYPPYTDWDWAWRDSTSGWVKGDFYVGYLLKPEQMGGGFREKNNNELPSISSNNAKIYFYLSDEYIGDLSPTYYWDIFNKNNLPDTFAIGDQKILFSSPTYNKIRYGVIDYNPEIAEMLYNANYSIVYESDPEKILRPESLNYVIVW